jgi:hypothetical protein
MTQWADGRTGMPVHTGVRVAGVQLHVTVPALSASFSPCKDRLPDVWPEA